MKYVLLVLAIFFNTAANAAEYRCINPHKHSVSMRSMGAACDVDVSKYVSLFKEGYAKKGCKLPQTQLDTIEQEELKFNRDILKTVGRKQYCEMLETTIKTMDELKEKIGARIKRNQIKKNDGRLDCANLYRGVVNTRMKWVNCGLGTKKINGPTTYDIRGCKLPQSQLDSIEEEQEVIEKKLFKSQGQQQYCQLPKLIVKTLSENQKR